MCLGKISTEQSELNPMKMSRPESRWFFLQIFCLIALLFATATARAGLTLKLDFYRNDFGNSYSFYTPLFTNSLAASPLGTYIISSPHQPTNGSVRGFVLSTNGLDDLYSADSENFYGDFNSAIYQITNGAWTILFTNATTTNIFHFTISAPTVSSNLLPVTLPNFPPPQSSILTTETNFSWQAPWPVPAFGQLYNFNSYYADTNLLTAQTNWSVPDLSPDANYNFSLQYLYTNNLFSITTPTNSISSQPLSGWDSMTVLESGFNYSFAVVASHGTASSGHTLLAYYTFEDNSLYVHDFSGSGNDMSYAYYTDQNPPTIVTNDAAAGTYAGGLPGGGWFTPPTSLTPLFAGSFSVSLWLKTTNTVGTDNNDQYGSAGIVSDLSGNYDHSVAPMLQSGSKIGFYTGGDQPNVLHSHASINTGQYVHVVTTRDQSTGQKCIYINGVLDATIFSSTNVLDGSNPDSISIGYNNGQVFSGKVDEIQFYAGVLSSNEVAFLHTHPGTNVADAVQLDFPAARYDFEDTNNAGIDSSFHHNDANCSGSSGTNMDIPSTNAMVGTFARQFFGDSSICFSGDYPGLSNALSGDFTVSAWINTTNSVNSDSDDAQYGMTIFYDYNNPTNGTIPISITGTKAAFTINNVNGSETTLHSTTSVTDGRYHLITVTRTRTNGVMSLYVDGVLEARVTGNTAPIQTTGTMFIGGGSYGYNGLMDDLRIYGGALSADDITKLAANGGTTFGGALGTTNLTWTTSGDVPWFVETTNTYNGAPAAAQSGSITGQQTSTLSVTVTGPGTLAFAWQNPTFNSLDLEFDIDGQYQNDIGGFTDWSEDGPYHIDAGQHTLSWTAFANDDEEPGDAAFLGQVTFVPSYVAAHYTFDESSSGFPRDVSGNGYDMNYGFSYNGGGSFKTNYAEAGAGSLFFFKNPSFSFSGAQVGWSSTPQGLLSALSGTFSISLWVKTTNNMGSAGDKASDGACIVAADVGGDANDLTPVALTGGAVAFGTGGTPGDNTLTSSRHVNDNAWHQIVVTRDQITGQKRIYIDGVEDSASPGMGTTALLNDPRSLSFCTRLDASYADPGDSPVANSYDGFLDDVQIYARVLTPDDVTFLYNHPGQVVTSTAQAPAPVNAQIRLEFYRNRDNSGAGNEYYVFPVITSISPAPTTLDEVSSPHGTFRGDFNGPFISSSSILNSLDSIVQECNGAWSLVINQGSVNQQTFTFNVSVTGLDTNALPPVTIYSPTNGSVNVSTNPVFYWSGPTSYKSLGVVAATPPLQNISASFAVTATNWPSPPTLNYGTNQFFVNYSNDFPSVTFSVPTDQNTGQPIANWTASAALYSLANSTFVVVESGNPPLRLTNIVQSGTNIQFSIPSLAGHTHTVQTSTNLNGTWIDLTNIAGDGGLKQFTFPRTNSPRFFRVKTQ